MKYLSTLILLLISNILIIAQNSKTIVLENPSLESIRRAGISNGMAPNGWLDCSMSNQTSVDLQPGYFEVNTPPKDGESYVGMIVRENDTYEAITQKMENEFQGLQAYRVTVHLAKSNNYNSLTPNSKEFQNFNKACVLRIYAGNEFCSKAQLLSISPPIDHEEWKSYEFLLIPKENYSHITFEAFYVVPTLVPYKGNLLMDDVSNIEPISKKEAKERLNNFSNVRVAAFEYPEGYF